LGSPTSSVPEVAGPAAIECCRKHLLRNICRPTVVARIIEAALGGGPPVGGRIGGAVSSFPGRCANASVMTTPSSWVNLVNRLFNSAGKQFSFNGARWPRA